MPAMSATAERSFSALHEANRSFRKSLICCHSRTQTLALFRQYLDRLLCPGGNEGPAHCLTATGYSRAQSTAIRTISRGTVGLRSSTGAYCSKSDSLFQSIQTDITTGAGSISKVGVQFAALGAGNFFYCAPNFCSRCPPCPAIRESGGARAPPCPMVSAPMNAAALLLNAAALPPL